MNLLNTVLCPLVDWMLAFATLGREVGEPLLESKPEDLHIDVVAELLTNDKEEVAEDEGSKEVDDVGAASEKSH